MGALIGRGLCGDLMNGGGGWGLSDCEGGDGVGNVFRIKICFFGNVCLSGLDQGDTVNLRVWNDGLGIVICDMWGYDTWSLWSSTQDCCGIGCPDAA